jgi:ketosteroid isomerase-like protein
MSRHDDVRLAVGRFFRAVDTRDWDVVGELLADDVSTDYTSIFGGAPEVLAGTDLVRQWESLLPGFDATQHFLSELLPTADSVVECNVRGYHHLDGQTWMVAGWYVITVTPDGPVRITGITITEIYETGSRDLLTRAETRAGSP